MQVEGAVKHSREFGHLSEMAKRIAPRIYTISISRETLVVLVVGGWVGGGGWKERKHEQEENEMDGIKGNGKKQKVVTEM